MGHPPQKSAHWPPARGDHIFPLISDKFPAQAKGGGLEEMEDGYWSLFWETGAPEFYLMRRENEENAGEQPEQD